MFDWNDAQGFQIEALLEALLFAYPRPADFETFLFLRLNRDYAQVAPAGENYRNALLAVLRAARGEGWLPDVVAQAVRHKPASPRLRTLHEAVGFTRVDAPAGLQLQDIVRTRAGFADLIPWIEKLERLAHRVCRIELPVGQGIGTGWLVADDLVLTNWHVVRRVLEGSAAPGQLQFRFDYAAGADGEVNPGTAVAAAADWCVDASPASPLELGTGAAGPGTATLDHALVRLSRAVARDELPRLGARGYISVRQQTGTQPGDVVMVLQHPQGDPVKLALGTAGADSGVRMLHDANTRSGSSGSPVLDAKLDPVALHHAGDPLYDGTDGDPRHNQAVPLAALVAHLRSRPGGPWLPGL